MALKGYNVEVLDAATGITMTSEATSTSDDTTYQITATTKRLLDLNTDIVVKDGGTATNEKYSISYLDGTVTFATSGTRTITIDGAYLTPSTIATANSYSFTGTCEALESTPFNTRYKTYVAGLVSGTINLGRFYATDSLFVDAILDGDIKIIKIIFDDSNYILAYGVMTNDTVDSTPSSLIGETATYQITKEIGVI